MELFSIKIRCTFQLVSTGITAKKENLPVRAIDKKSPLNLLTVQGTSRARQSGIFGTRAGL